MSKPENMQKHVLHDERQTAKRADQADAMSERRAEHADAAEERRLARLERAEETTTTPEPETSTTPDPMLAKVAKNVQTVKDTLYPHGHANAVTEEALLREVDDGTPVKPGRIE